jgi:hypothetical protein
MTLATNESAPISAPGIPFASRCRTAIQTAITYSVRTVAFLVLWVMVVLAMTPGDRLHAYDYTASKTESVATLIQMHAKLAAECRNSLSDPHSDGSI